MKDDESFEDESTKDDESIYSDEAREQMVEDDQIEPFEEGFMMGADIDGQHAKCRRCGRLLISPKNVIEREVEGEKIRFCSNYCADKFEQQHG